MNHYYSETQDVASNEKSIVIKIKETTLNIITDNGVFAKNGLDFGTRLLLESLETEKLEGNILDFGCGYGPIGIYLKKTTKANVDMIDINERSVHLATKNAKKNKVEINTFKSNKFDNISKKYNYIITNPPIRIGKKELFNILETSKQYLEKNGELWLVIHKDQGAKSTAAFLENFFEVEITNKDKGFYIIRAVNH